MLPSHRRLQGGAGHQRTLVFVGQSDNIPECLVDALEREFPWLYLEQVEDLDELLMEFKYPVSLILLDSDFLSDLDMYSQRILRLHPKGGLAVLFDDVESASRRYTEIMAQPVIRSVLPMNLKLDLWLAVVALLLRGGEHMPTALARAVPSNLGLQHHPAEGVQQVISGFGDVGRGLSNGAALDELTEREFEVLELVAKGAPNKLIAADLDLSEHTVKIHIHNIIRKLRVHNRTEAAAIFLRASSGKHDDDGGES